MSCPVEVGTEPWADVAPPRVRSVRIAARRSRVSRGRAAPVTGTAADRHQNFHLVQEKWQRSTDRCTCTGWDRIGPESPIRKPTKRDPRSAETIAARRTSSPAREMGVDGGSAPRRRGACSGVWRLSHRHRGDFRHCRTSRGDCARDGRRKRTPARRSISPMSSSGSQSMSPRRSRSAMTSTPSSRATT